jgi:uncharacterized protein Yka (UPF0111/DUF47 family)
MSWLTNILPFAARTRPRDAFVEQFQTIAALALAATDQLAVALEGDPEQALERIIKLEHTADEVVGQVNRLVDETFIPPYDKRDIVHLAHELDDVVDGLRTAVRQIVSYHALNVQDGLALTTLAKAFNDLIRRAVIELKRVVDGMPKLDHDDVRKAARTLAVLETEGDELFARAIQELFPDPNQPLTAAMLAWRDIFRQLERITDGCEHAMNVIVSIARQEGH